MRTDKKYERIVRRIRQRIFDYPPELDEKAARVLRKCLVRIPKTPPKVDQWGATAEDRRQLARQGICWGD